MIIDILCGGVCIYCFNVFKVAKPPIQKRVYNNSILTKKEYDYESIKAHEVARDVCIYP